ncbi:putative colanic acid biosynthesis acetyltransferase [Mesorhizobium sp. M0213]|uniref:putative colanic acid biosynthesis acetyltransferase n=1 Tax=Mesorhizobium sp. M0213 TaxID=2956917 RepID=UPI003337F497
MLDKRSFKLAAVPAPSGSDKLRRALWRLVERTAYGWSPTPFHRWRCFLLRSFGAKIEVGAHPYPSARVWAPWNLRMGRASCLGPEATCYSVAEIAIGDYVTISQGAYLCSATHDYRDPNFPLVVGNISIEDGAWVAAGAFVGPGVKIGKGAIVGARAVVVKDLEPGVVVAGNPARQVGSR